MFNLSFVKAADFSEIKKKGRKLIKINNKSIVLFYLEGKVYAIDSVCAHKGGPLEEGELIDEEIICPWHAFMYNIKTGACLNSPGYSVKPYKIQIKNDDVMIEVD